MAHIRIERFGTGDAQKHPAQDGQGDRGVMQDEPDGMSGVEG